MAGSVPGLHIGIPVDTIPGNRCSGARLIVEWKRLIQELLDAALTQAEIASRCGVKQSTVSDLYRLPERTPNYDFGRALIDLHKRTTRASKRKEGAQAASPLTQDDIDHAVCGAARPDYAPRGYHSKPRRKTDGPSHHSESK